MAQLSCPSAGANWHPIIKNREPYRTTTILDCNVEKNISNITVGALLRSVVIGYLCNFHLAGPVFSETCKRWPMNIATCVPRKIFCKNRMLEIYMNCKRPAHGTQKRNFVPLMVQLHRDIGRLTGLFHVFFKNKFNLTNLLLVFCSYHFWDYVDSFT